MISVHKFRTLSSFSSNVCLLALMQKRYVYLKKVLLLGTVTLRSDVL